MTKLTFLLCISLFIVEGCHRNSSDESKKTLVIDSVGTKTDENVIDDTAFVNKDSLLEKKIMERIEQLPLVKQSQHYIDSFSNHKMGMAFIIEGPSGENTDYYIMAGFDGEIRFETYYHFYVNPNTFDIKIQDIVSGDLLSVEEWEKRNK